MTSPAPDSERDVLIDLAASFTGGHVPLSAIVAAGISEESLQNRISDLQSRIRVASSSQIKPDLIYGGLKTVFDETTELSAILEQACAKGASLRPRARHALEALQVITAVKIYLNSVNAIRDALSTFEYSTKLMFNDANGAALSDDYIAIMVKHVDLLCLTWTKHRSQLDPETTAFRWATERIQNFLVSYRRALEKAAAGTLSDISWPCTQAGSTLRLNDDNVRNRARLLLQTLFKLQQSFEPDASPDKYWVISLLTNPIVTRFVFHFERDCSTNRPDKPEWFLGYISRCLSQHLPVLGVLLPGVPDLSGAFTEKLLTLVKAKASGLLDQLASSDDANLFRHCLKHILSFSPSISQILSNPEIQSKFLAIEQDAANAQLDFIFDGLASPWQRLDASVSSLVTTNSADVFLAMLFQISEKIIGKLPLLADRLDFAQLQQALIVSYIERCESLLGLRLKDINQGGIRTSTVESANWSAFIGIINSLDSIRIVLEEWNDNIVYVELQYFRDNKDLKNRESLSPNDLLLDPNFEDSVSASFFSLECKRSHALVVEFVDVSAQVVLKAFRMAASFYINRNNLMQPMREKSETEISLSATLCDGLSVLSSSLNLAASQFGERSFQNFWLAVAKGLDVVLFDGLIREKYFTTAAVRQLNFDFNAILTLFRSYIDRPDAAMPMLSTAVELLQSPVELIQELVDTESGLPFGLPADTVLDICRRILTVASVDHYTD